MKNRMNRTASGMALALGLIAGGVQSLSAAVPVSTVWEFATGSNSAVPDSAAGITGTSHATVSPGLFAEGWVGQLTGLPGANGVWDLGNSGTITLNNPAGIAGPNAQERNITVKVVQYHDSGGFYDQATVVSVPGATLLSNNTYTVASGGNFGNWVAQETVWQADANSAVNTILITGATGAKKGSVIDQVVVQTSVVATAPQLSIRNLGTDNRQVEISWSADYAGMDLQSTADPADASGWSKVTQTPQLSGATYSLTVEASGAKFYRLKQP